MTVPDLSKMTEDAAKAALKELRLGVNVQTGTSDDVRRDRSMISLRQQVQR